MDFCRQGNLNSHHTSAINVIEFFTTLFPTRGYSALSTARAAIATIVLLPDGYTVSNHPLIIRYFKGIFNLKPPSPRYRAVWDVKIVLDFLRSLSPAKTLGLRDLTFKVTMLMALLTAQRQQTLKYLNISQMKIGPDKFVFQVNDILKTSKPGKIGVTIEMCAYPPEKRLCIYKYLTEYLKRTKELRGKEKQLLISFRKPYTPVTTDTIARWLRTVMLNSGLDITEYKAHSVRTAAVSNAFAANIPVEDIISQAGWVNEKTFQKWYQKPIHQMPQTVNRFASALLKRD